MFIKIGFWKLFYGIKLPIMTGFYSTSFILLSIMYTGY